MHLYLGGNVGLANGNGDGLIEGLPVGITVGCILLGCGEGRRVGSFDRCGVGRIVGDLEGRCDHGALTG